MRKLVAFSIMAVFCASSAVALTTLPMYPASKTVKCHLHSFDGQLVSILTGEIRETTTLEGEEGLHNLLSFSSIDGEFSDLEVRLPAKQISFGMSFNKTVDRDSNSSVQIPPPPPNAFDPYVSYNFVTNVGSQLQWSVSVSESGNLSATGICELKPVYAPDDGDEK
ncbi:hypothetical protein SAMN02745824_2631 [Parasphingorhabdus marina DSM 22363]|uniref:Uncharacterized protein n=1 Tax=Parasphingorhabdus marina DSM 22363 TaxID=1123272 RepID=A0A1N6G108_9SPHN|nr:hypothetical protein [Parasphingorhabdus marina]SIO01229.1 hypothetical protein SAMN02745824_2631 [Parasphingorhabdus marina DSM 22363]